MSAPRGRTSHRTLPSTPKLHPQAEKSHSRPVEGHAIPAKESQTVTKEQFASVSNTSLKAFEQFAAIGKANVEAAIKTNAVLLKGAEEIGKAWTTLAQRVLEAHMNSMQALVGCKNLKDVVEVQTDWAKTQLETVVAEGAKVSELTLKVANESVQPLSATVNETMKSSLKAA